MRVGGTNPSTYICSKELVCLMYTLYVFAYVHTVPHIYETNVQTYCTMKSIVKQVNIVLLTVLFRIYLLVLVLLLAICTLLVQPTLISPLNLNHPTSIHPPPPFKFSIHWASLWPSFLQSGFNIKSINSTTAYIFQLNSLVII